MDKLRILPVAFVCGLLSTPALAQLTTIGPGTPGVTESLMTLTQTSVVNGFPFYSPVFTQVSLGSKAVAVGSGDFDMTMSCFKGCAFANFGITAFEMFDVTFSKPVSFVSALQLSGDQMGAALWAYNGADQLVGSCVATVDYPYPPFSGCYKYVSVTNQGASITTSYTVAESLANISTVLIGGYGSDQSEVMSVAFSATPIKGVPEPGTLSLLALASIGFVIQRRYTAS